MCIMTPAAPTDEIVSIQAADLLGVDVSTVSRWVKRGTLVPSRRLPGKKGQFLFWRADVVRLAEQQAADREAS